MKQKEFNMITEVFFNNLIEFNIIDTIKIEEGYYIILVKLENNIIVRFTVKDNIIVHIEIV